MHRGGGAAPLERDKSCAACYHPLAQQQSKRNATQCEATANPSSDSTLLVQTANSILAARHTSKPSWLRFQM
ncbi:hypothetical protein DM02DRAFT_612368 [Periconia macrospinosa]|uniref:Uncharacterized protein n=1 Tax=Periconia macrospinosa TaxID=97972 RepID=A0A2V1E0X9_9PLEO|nr:hypothetical protein DM02DRAFT_612368 [Periconia macrospinosa]